MQRVEAEHASNRKLTPQRTMADKTLQKHQFRESTTAGIEGGFQGSSGSVLWAKAEYFVLGGVDCGIGDDAATAPIITKAA